MLNEKGMIFVKALSYKEDGFVAILTIKHPPVNALSFKLFDEISEILNVIEEQNKMKVMIIKGDGKFFSAGADLSEFMSYQKETGDESLVNKGQQLFQRLEDFHIPIIASIHGAALGGGLELALGCHIRIVTKDAKLGLPELTLGLIPGYGGTQRLPQIIGLAKSYEMILTGTTIDGIEAERLGLVNYAVEKEELDRVTIELARQVAEKSRESINQVMKLIPFAKTEKFSEGIKAESEAAEKIFRSSQAKEWIQAFMEKRKPNFFD